jgi:ribosomal protein S18 acetylase RimI-like enzyme
MIELEKPSFEIRRAVKRDAAGIGKVHVDSWQTTYSGIIDPNYLASRTYERSTQSALNRITVAEIDCFVVIDHFSGQVIGFADCGASREKNLEAQGELYAIYLLQQFQGMRIGRKLFDTCVQALKGRGYKDFFVSVLSDNLGSVAFYQRMGGQLIGHDRVEIAGVFYPTDNYQYRID